MLSVKEAKEILFGQVKQLPAVSLKVVEAAGYVLAEDVIAPIDLPTFDNSAMDGYAVCVDHFPEQEQIVSLPLAGETRAGGKPLELMKKNTAIRIYTGAAVPKNASCIVIQEKAEYRDSRLFFSSSEMKPDAHIRKRASQIKRGETALFAGMQINPAAMGWLCSLGIVAIDVVKRPRVSVLATGNELKKPGTTLAPGQIYESNTFALKAALEQGNFQTVRVKSVPDQPKKTFDVVQKMLNSSDVVIISGGISVGKYDLVRDTLSAIGVEQIWYKIAQKPGKPMFAGRFGSTEHPKYIFALPGNPAAALVCFYEYVLPVLNKLSGLEEITLKSALLPLAQDYTTKGDRALFLRALAAAGTVRILEGQESNMMRSFATSNAIVYLPARSAPLLQGSLIETHFLP